MPSSFAVPDIRFDGVYFSKQFKAQYQNLEPPEQAKVEWLVRELLSRNLPGIERIERSFDPRGNDIYIIRLDPSCRVSLRILQVMEGDKTKTFAVLKAVGY